MFGTEPAVFFREKAHNAKLWCYIISIYWLKIINVYYGYLHYFCWQLCCIGMFV